MDASLTHSILKEFKIAYVLSNHELNVVGANDVVGLLGPIRLDRSVLDLFPELDAHRFALQAVLTGQRARFELGTIERETDRGRVIHLQLAVLPYWGQTGRIMGLLCLLQDVSPRVALTKRLARREAELDVARSEWQRLDEVKSTFISAAAHKLRTPLTPIKGYVEMLLEEDLGPLSDEQREYLRLVETGASQLLDVLNHLLDLARIETGQLKLALEPVDVTALVEQVVAAFGSKFRAQGQTLILRARPGLPPVLADVIRVKQVLGVLLSNANRHTPEGGDITLDFELDETRDVVQVSIADTGPGLTRQDQARLFERFSRSLGERQSGGTGIGLGLYTARKLIELHGGRVWVESEGVPGQGSTFYVTLPTIEELV